MNIQWFPGHMERARKQIRQRLSKTDVVLEVCDARAPGSTLNPLLESLARDKILIRVANKVDLADSPRLREWLRSRAEGAQWSLVSVARGKGLAELRREIERRCSSKASKSTRALRVLVVGVPNAGKSALINALAGGRRAAVANRPGFTRGTQMISLEEGMVLWDSPGILWPKIADSRQGACLALLGIIKEEILDPVELFEFVFREQLFTHHSQALRSRYGLETAPLHPLEVLHHVAKTQIPLLSGGNPDIPAAARRILKDFREGRLGPVFLET